MEYIKNKASKIWQYLFKRNYTGVTMLLHREFPTHDDVNSALSRVTENISALAVTVKANAKTLAKNIHEQTKVDAFTDKVEAELDKLIDVPMEGTKPAKTAKTKKG